MTAVNQDVGLVATDPVYPGATIRLTVPVTDAAGDPKSLVSAAIIYGLYGAPPAKDLDAWPIYLLIVGDGVTVTDAVGGIFQALLTAAQTALLPPGDYYHQAVVTDAAGDVDPVLTGTVRLTAIGQ